MIAIALAAFTKYEVTNRVKLVEGRAAETLKTIRGEFDIIFIDADKPGYTTYLEIILDKGLLSKTGIIITDNSTLPRTRIASFYIPLWQSRFFPCAADNSISLFFAQTISASVRADCSSDAWDG